MIYFKNNKYLSKIEFKKIQYLKKIIPTRTIILVQNYLLTIKKNIPERILYICINYFNCDKDYFDRDKYSDVYIHLDKNKTTLTCLQSNTKFRSTCFLRNIIEKGKHIWRFQFFCAKSFYCGTNDQHGAEIGIFRINPEYQFKYFQTDKISLLYFDELTRLYPHNGKETSGFGLLTCGHLTNICNPDIYGDWIHKPVMNEEIIQIILDLNIQKIIICNEKYPKTFSYFDISKELWFWNGRYASQYSFCAAVSVEIGVSIKLLQYQEFV